MPATLNHGITYPAGTTAPNVPVDMQAQAQSVEVALNALKALMDPAFVPAAFLNSWSNFSGTYQGLNFHKVGNLVHVTGMIKPGTTTSGIACATIPAGMVPDQHMNQNVGANVAGAYSSTTIAQFSSTGQVLLFGIPGGASYLMFNCQYLVDTL